MNDELDPKRIPQHRIRSFRETYFSEDAAASPVNHVGPEVAGFDPLLVRALRWRARKGTLPRATKVPDDGRAALDAGSTWADRMNLHETDAGSFRSTSVQDHEAKSSI